MDVPSANAPQFTLNILGVRHDLQVLAFSGEEAIGAPCIFKIGCVSERANLDLEALLNQPAFLCFGYRGEGITAC